jgi:hypothetical protein
LLALEDNGKNCQALFAAPKPERDPKMTVPMTTSLEMIAEVPVVDDMADGRGT